MLRDWGTAIIDHRGWFFKGIVFVGLTVLIFFLLNVTYNQITNYGLNVLNPSPSEEFHQQIVHIDCSQSKNRVDLGTNDTANLPLCSVDVALEYYGPLVEGIPVNVAAMGFVYPEGQNDLKSVFDNKTQTFFYSAIIGFEGASVYNESNIPINGFQGNLIGGAIVVPLMNETGYQKIRTDHIPPLTPIYQTITWPVQGDYYPFVTVDFKNQTGFYTITFPDTKIHVDSEEVKRQDDYSKINTWLTIALFFFTLLASLEIWYKLLPLRIKRWFGVEDNTKNGDNGTSGDPNHPGQIKDRHAVLPKDSAIKQKSDKQKGK